MRTNISYRWNILLIAGSILGCAEGSPDFAAQNETNSGDFGDLVGVVVENSCDTNMAAMPPIRQIALGSNASFALDEEGNVWSWGGLSAGESYGSTPARMMDLSNVTQIATGMRHACALLADGTLRCWGENAFGKLGNGTVSGTASPIGVKPVEVIGLDKVVQVSCGQYHTCAVREDGSVWCWGQRGSFRDWNTSGPLEQVTPYQIPGMSDVIAVGAGSGYYTCALSRMGQVTCWGFGIVDQDIYWGSGYQGEILAKYYVMPTKGPVEKLVVAGGSCVLLRDHTVQCFSGLFPDPAELWKDVKEFSIGRYERFFCASLQGEETRCYSTTPDRFDPMMNSAIALPNVGSVTHLAVDAEHACGMDKGCMKCWGENEWGQIGIGSNEDARRPTPVQWAVP